MISPKVKAVFFFCLALTFGVLIFGGYAINKEKPPIPAKVLGFLAARRGNQLS
ncbi:hypothetical protein Deval_1305 [Nitratidesulfovibrio vulgaris RCH1]|nr:hypothetical protein Deval_1305 [Nitratidesulfovibrio vulgaris RCH1]